MVPETSSLVFLQYLTTVFDNITDAIMLIGIEKGGYRLLTANTAFFAISGYPRESIGKEVGEIVSPTAYHFLLNQYKKAMQAKRPIEYSHWSDVPIGRRAYAVKIIPVLNTVGEPVQLAAVTRDVTEWEETRTELRQLRKKLQAHATQNDNS